MKYHITITDNETGEVLVDQDTVAIIGACDAGEATRGLVLHKCNKAEKMATACEAMQMVEQVLRKEPKKFQRFARKLVRKAVRENA
jgi:hypothetical protein